MEWCVASEGGGVALYSRGRRGGRVAAGALWTHGERRREAPTRGDRVQHQRRRLPTLADEHRRRFEMGTSTRAHCAVLAATGLA